MPSFFIAIFSALVRFFFKKFSVRIAAYAAMMAIFLGLYLAFSLGIYALMETLPTSTPFQVNIAASWIFPERTNVYIGAVVAARILLFTLRAGNAVLKMKEKIWVE